MLLSDLEELAENYFVEIKRNSEATLPNLYVFRREQVSNIEVVLYNPVICLILRGGKQTSVGNQSVTLARGDALVVSHDLPMSAKITQASPEEPYLAIIIMLDLGIIRGLYEQVGETVNEIEEAHSLSTRKFDAMWADPLKRYLELSGKPLEAQVLGPLILKEIHFRLLLSPVGTMLRKLLSVDSHASRIAKAVAHIRKRFRETLIVAEIAQLSAMSPSTFHEHFKSVTGTTPLQYQKDLRMIEAQRFLTEGGLSVSAVGHEVGYESPTHFSRDYTRKFGCSPKHHLGVGKNTVLSD